MKPALSLVAVAALLLLGIAIGVLGVFVVHHDDLRRAFWRHHDERLVAEDLIEVLELTPEQALEAEHILQDSEAEVRTIHESVLPLVQEHLERTHARLLEVLDPEQRARLEQLHRTHGDLLEELMLHIEGHLEHRHE
jgi:hypothetical protein